MTTVEKIAVMQAYVDGKQIQYRQKTEETWVNVRKDCGLSWDWITFDYRIKPEPKKPTYRPYNDFEEFKVDWDKHGGWVKDDDCKCHLLTVFSSRYTKCLMDVHTWADDGSPCGVLVEEGGEV